MLLLLNGTAEAEPKADETAGYRTIPAFQEPAAQPPVEPFGDSASVLASGNIPREVIEGSVSSQQEQDPMVQETEADISETKTKSEMTEEEKEQAALDSRKIVINLASCSLSLYEGNKKIRLYPIAIGKPSTPTPIGYYEIRSKDINPTWIDPKDPEFSVPSGEANPLGYRWMEIQGTYGIHGTNRPDSIGNYVSNGCIRMFEEDVEALFNLVQIGTPVEITYNRIVVEKTPEDMVAYYIYPDYYGRQSVDAALVNEWLKGYGIQSFEPDEAIEKKIRESDGEPTYIGKVYGIVLDGQKISAKAVVQDNIVYLPAMEIAAAVNIDLGWDEKRSVLMTSLGEAAGYDKKDYLYLKAEDALRLFHLQGVLRPDKLYALDTVNVPSAVRPSTQEPPKNEPAPPSSESRPWQRETIPQPEPQTERTAGNRGGSTTEDLTERRETPPPSAGKRPVLKRVDLDGEIE